MKILVLRSSGNIHGSSNMLADAFIRGAKQAGHIIMDYDVMRKDIRPCRGCNYCRMSGPCFQKDDFENELKGMIREANMLVFVMPVYYFGWPSQLKAVVDRFYSFSFELTMMYKKAVLLTVAWDDTDEVFEVTAEQYHKLCDYLQFDDWGTVLGKGCGTPEKTKKSRYIQEAYDLGRSA